LFKLAVYLKPYRKQVTLGPVFKLLEAIFELLLPTLVALIVNNGIGQRDSGYVIRMGGLMLLLSVIGYGCSLVCQYYAAHASQGFGTLLRNTLFKRISAFSYAEVDQFSTASLINRVTNDVNQLQLAVAMLIRLVIRAPFICIGAVIMSMILDFRLGLILIAATPVFAIILYLIITKSAPMYRLYQQKLDRIALLLSENLTGVRVIRAFAKSREEKAKFEGASSDLTATAIRVGRISALLNPITTLTVNATIIAILWVGGVHIDTGSLSQGEIIAFINYVTQMLLALIVVSNLVIIFTKAASSAARVNEVLAVEPSIADFPAEEQTQDRGQNQGQSQDRNQGQKQNWDQGQNQPGTEISQPSINSHPASQTSDRPVAIRFDRVSFGYSATGERALTDVSVEIMKGETIGIIGGTGSGKSTFVNLIPRFYEVNEGVVEVDGRDVRTYALADLRSKLGIVPQKAVLFTGTIAENLRWGNEQASDEALAQAATIAQAAEFINKLPEGMDTLITRGGRNLSGGQKQRLTIARAVVSQPDILVLDDSASALDFATDAALRSALRENSREMTVLLVSQRISTIKHADKIIVFDEGRIVGLGKHEQLRATNEIYREVCESQLSEEEAAR
jgi:ATP-binding cassette subfamily B protein